MASVKNIVKVMNFHSLIRVDKAKREASKYFDVEKELKKLLYKIVNNRNLKIDKKVNVANEEGITLNIYIGNDLGFCGNFNSQLQSAIANDKGSYKIIIGKKISRIIDDTVLINIRKDEFYNEYSKIEKTINELIINHKIKDVNVIFNYYHSISEITFEKIQVFPVVINDLDEEMKNENYESDFVIEMNVDEIITSIIVLYICYQVKVYECNSLASENVMRERVTRESIKKIEEKEEEQLKINRKLINQEKFKKQINNQKIITEEVG